jgi:hypothetical protein
MDKKNKTVFSNFENDKKNKTIHTNKCHGPFMNEFGDDIISEVVENEIRVKPKNKKIDNQKNSSKN